MKKRISRRGFLKGIFHGAGFAIFAKISPLVPEASAFFSSSRQNNPLPENAEVNELTGAEAQELIDRALNYNDSNRLRRHLADFTAQADDARALTASWEDERGRQHEGQVATIPLENGDVANACLFYSEIDGQTQSILTVIVTDGQAIEGADIYYIANGRIRTRRRRLHSNESAQAFKSNKAQPTMNHVPCTQDCLLSCLQQFGCTGFAFTLCAAAILSCPFFIATCIAAYACTLYCGGAFSICWDDICCHAV